MGLLALGTPLTWEQTKPLADHIRDHGITQFLNTWDRWKDKAGKGLLWGDEVSLRFLVLGTSRTLILGQIEYMVASFDDEQKMARLSLRQTEILKKLKSVTLDPALEKFKPSEWYVSDVLL